MKRLVIGSRASKLALVQAEMVAGKFKTILPHTQIEIREISTSGDRDKETPLDKMSAVGVFVKELEKALEMREVDLAVHSLKDMPSEQPANLMLSAVLKREDFRDVLISHKGNLENLPQGARIGTGSLRREIQIKLKRPDLVTLPLRGNLDTRLSKLEQGKYDAIIMAAAGLIRMNMINIITQFLPADHFIPAGCQGIIGIEIRREDDLLHDVLQALNHLPTWHEAETERAFLHVLGAGCHAPVAVKATSQSKNTLISVMVADGNRKPVIFESVTAPIDKTIQSAVNLAKYCKTKGEPDFSER